MASSFKNQLCNSGSQLASLTFEHRVFLLPECLDMFVVLKSIFCHCHIDIRPQSFYGGCIECSLFTEKNMDSGSYWVFIVLTKKRKLRPTVSCGVISGPPKCLLKSELAVGGLSLGAREQFLKYAKLLRNFNSEHQEGGRVKGVVQLLWNISSRGLSRNRYLLQ